MTHIALYFGCVFGGLFAIFCGLGFWARATKWKPKPIRPIWAIAVIVAADFVAGLLCSIYGRDIHILYWFLLGLPAVAISIPIFVVLTELFVRLVLRVFCLVVQRFQSKRG
jgi:hypothetical protein